MPPAGPNSPGVRLSHVLEDPMYFVILAVCALSYAVLLWLGVPGTVALLGALVITICIFVVGDRTVGRWITEWQMRRKW